MCDTAKELRLSGCLHWRDCSLRTGTLWYGHWGAQQWLSSIAVHRSRTRTWDMRSMLVNMQAQVCLAEKPLDVDQGVCFFSLPFTWHCSMFLPLKVIYWLNAAYYYIVWNVTSLSILFLYKYTSAANTLVWRECQWVRQGVGTTTPHLFSHLSIPSSLLLLKINVSSARFTSEYLTFHPSACSYFDYSSFRVYFYGLCWTLQTDFTMMYLLVLLIFFPATES